jgi:hypothetical protein
MTAFAKSWRRSEPTKGGFGGNRASASAESVEEFGLGASLKNTYMCQLNDFKIIAHRYERLPDRQAARC